MALSHRFKFIRFQIFSGRLEEGKMFPCPVMVYYNTWANWDVHSMCHNVQQGSVPYLLFLSKVKLNNGTRKLTQLQIIESNRVQCRLCNWQQKLAWDEGYHPCWSSLVCVIYVLWLWFFFKGHGQYSKVSRKYNVSPLQLGCSHESIVIRSLDMPFSENFCKLFCYI